MHALSQWALKFDVKKRLEDEFMLHNNKGALTTNNTSIDSNPEHQNNKLALKNAHHALKKSIASAKDSAQRRYRSPCRQKDRINNSRNYRMNNELFDFAPADLGMRKGELISESTNLGGKKSVFSGQGSRSRVSGANAHGDLLASHDGSTKKGSYMHKFINAGSTADSAHGRGAGGQSLGPLARQSYGGGFAMVSSRNSSDERRDSSKP